jgi:hypothetical protein
MKHNASNSGRMGVKKLSRWNLSSRPHAKCQWSKALVVRTFKFMIQKSCLTGKRTSATLPMIDGSKFLATLGSDRDPATQAKSTLIGFSQSTRTRRNSFTNSPSRRQHFSRKAERHGTPEEGFYRFSIRSIDISD